MDTERKPTYDELLAENRQLKVRVAELEIKAARVDELEQQVADLKAQVDKLTKMLFGKKSEKSKKKDQETEASSDDSPSGDADTSKKKRKKNGGGGRKPFPPEIPRRDVHVDLSPDECRCDCCGEVFEPMGVEITEVLNYIPMTCKVIRYIRHRYKRTCNCRKNKIVIAESIRKRHSRIFRRLRSTHSMRRPQKL